VLRRWGEKPATGLPAYAGYPKTLPYVPCAYTPAQVRKAYGMDGPINSATTDGQTVAIVDAYCRPPGVRHEHLRAVNDPSHPLGKRLTPLRAPSFTHKAECGAPGWTGEQSLDIEAVHSLAPGPTSSTSGRPAAATRT